MDPQTQGYVFDWLMLAFIVAGIAQGKGRSGFNWFFVTALFGPLALIAVVFVDSIKKP